MKEEINKMLEEFAESLGENYDTSNDKGTDSLISDLAVLTKEALGYEFHDFKNTKYATPKLELMNRLSAMRENIEDGIYDN